MYTSRRQGSNASTLPVFRKGTWWNPRTTTEPPTAQSVSNRTAISASPIHSGASRGEVRFSHTTPPGAAMETDSSKDCVVDACMEHIAPAYAMSGPIARPMNP